ncbi:DNA recombination protein RmuC [Flavobacteriaceae bacterium S0862]|nr:DNA recombination protein RmuC [Flavobacteriaceae bacterium S0862]
MEKYIYLVVGFGVGALIIYLWLRQQFSAQNATLQANVKQAKEVQQELQEENDVLSNENGTLKDNEADLKTSLAEKVVSISGLNKDLNKLQSSLDELEQEFKDKTNNYNALNSQLATANANNTALEDKLATQKDEIEAMGEKFNTEFENIAAKILKDNTKTFTELNETKIKELLNPLGQNLKDFKKKVDDVYNEEARQRFSLGEKVKDLVDLSESLRKEAQNLTTALKADPKKQGSWGEMILERILEQSGLAKDREYYLENYLKDDNGNYMINDEGQKMRPDAIIQYPDERKVIIDAKVSINAYIRYVEAETSEEQKSHLKEHIAAIKTHINTLSNRGYENFEKSLDYVMMFIPNEAAFMVALKEDANLWQFAYKKRIVIISPTNLIVTLKIIEDLWKREYQNQNSKAIADRGMKLYEKFVGFTDNFKKVGRHIELADSTYNAALKQLAGGNDNLVSQTLKMKALGVDSKKKLDPLFLEGNEVDTDEILKLNNKNSDI